MKESTMNTEANLALNASRKAIVDKVEAEIHRFEAQLGTLKARAESVKADIELQAIVDLITAKRTLDRKLAALKQASNQAFEQIKTDLDARIASFARALKSIEAKIKAA